MSTAVRDMKRKAKTIKSTPVKTATRTPIALRSGEAPRQIPITRQPYDRRRKFNVELMVKAVDVAQRPERLTHLPEREQEMVKMAAETITRGASLPPLGGARGNGLRGGGGQRYQGPVPISVTQLAQEAARALAPSSGTTPADIEVALRRQGIDWVEPFAPGRPLTPYYGYGRRMRQQDFRAGRNISTDTRPDRMPFALLKQLNEGYDIATICTRHIIQDMRAMKLSFGPMDDYDGDVSKEILEVKKFLRRPDGNRPFPIWLAQWMMDILRYDAGCLYRERNRAGKVIALKVVDGTTVAPIVDYYGDRPIPPAPFLQQYVQGIPWDWVTTDDVIYEPHWPLPESPYGVAPAETIIINANTDVRLQLFFLQFFTAGSVPEMLLEAPPDMSDTDGLAELQETWDNFYEANQAGRHGAHWVPSGAKPHPYKPDKFDPQLAEYVMRRSVAAFGLVPQDLGFTETVNRSTADAQADTQFRISTLPNTEIYEAILNMVIQDDLGLPVDVSFDTGREKKDRLMEAQAHKLYVDMGAESADEVRDQILGLPVDNDDRMPRFIESPRLGPIPIAWIKSVSGRIDPSTLSPFGQIPPQPFIPIAGQKENIPPETPPTEPDGDPAADARDAASKPKAKPKAQPAAMQVEPPLLPTGTALPPNTGVAKPFQRSEDVHEQVGDMHTDPEGRIGPDGHAGVPTVKLEGAVTRNAFRVDEHGGHIPTPGTTEGSVGPRRPQGSSAPARTRPPASSSSPAGTMGTSVSTRENARTPRRNANKMEGGITTGTAIAGVDLVGADDDEDDDVILLSQEARKEMCRWREVARKKAKHKKKQRHFESDVIPQDVSERLHIQLANAETREEVDKVFESAMSPRNPNPKPAPLDVHRINGLALRAGDTGRVLMMQRAMTHGDPAAGMWEFPGGHKHFNETNRQGAVREWEEETGIRFPAKAQLFSSWDSFNGRYKGWVYEIPSETDVDIDGRDEVPNPDGDAFEAVAWFDPRDLSNHPALRQELKADIAIVQSALNWPRKKDMIGIE